MKKFVVGVLALVLILTLVGCDVVTKSDKHPKTKATFNISPNSHSSLSISEIKAADAGTNFLKLKISRLYVQHDSLGVGLCVISNNSFSDGNGVLHDNAGWYDVTKPLTETVFTDFNAGSHSVACLAIEGVSGNINGHPVSAPGLSNDIYFTNSPNQIEISFPIRPSPPYNIVSFNPVVIQDDTTDLILTLSLDIGEVFDSTNKLIPDWWKKIKLTAVTIPPM